MRRLKVAFAATRPPTIARACEADMVCAGAVSKRDVGVFVVATVRFALR